MFICDGLLGLTYGSSQVAQSAPRSQASAKAVKSCKRFLWQLVQHAAVFVIHTPRTKYKSSSQKTPKTQWSVTGMQLPFGSLVPCWHQFLETVTGPPVSAPCKHHLCANQGSPICAKLCYGFAWPFARPFPRPQKHKLSFKLRMYSLWLFGIRLYSTLKPMCESSPQNALTSFICLNRGTCNWPGRKSAAQVSKAALMLPTFSLPVQQSPTK